MRRLKIHESEQPKIYLNVHNLNHPNQQSIRFFSSSYILINAQIKLRAWELKSFSRWSRKMRRSSAWRRIIWHVTKKYRLFMVLLSSYRWYYWRKFSSRLTVGYREKKNLWFIQLVVREKKEGKKERQRRWLTDSNRLKSNHVT